MHVKIQTTWKLVIIVLLVYFVWLHSQDILIKRHVNIGLAHIVCQLMLSILIFFLQRQKGKKLIYCCFCFILNLFFIFECAHHNGYWCITHPLNKKWMCDRLREIKTAFEKHNISWKLSHGSALGAYRDYPKNKIGIPYEKDEDIIIDIERKDLAISILDPILSSKPWFAASSEIKIDTDNNFRPISKGSTKPIEYCGTLLPISSIVETELKEYYGGDFMTPKMIPARIGINREIGCSIYIDSIHEPLWFGRLLFVLYMIFFLYNFHWLLIC